MQHLTVLQALPAGKYAGQSCTQIACCGTKQIAMKSIIKYFALTVGLTPARREHCILLCLVTRSEIRQCYNCNLGRVLADACCHRSGCAAKCTLFRTSNRQAIQISCHVVQCTNVQPKHRTQVKQPGRASNSIFFLRHCRRCTRAVLLCRKISFTSRRGGTRKRCSSGMANGVAKNIHRKSKVFTGGGCMGKAEQSRRIGAAPLRIHLVCIGCSLLCSTSARLANQ